MSEVKLDIILKTPQGGAVKSEDDDLTLGMACILALDAGLQSDANEGLKSKMRRGRLIEKIETALDAKVACEFSVADITMVTERVATIFTSAHVVRQIVLLLDPGAETE